MKICNHLFVDGFGGMGDALVCEKCGLDKYPEAMPVAYAVAALQGRVVRGRAHDYARHVKAAQDARERRGEE